ncbi:MAG TPA: hypothetical protein VFS43_11510 [Polyangiaceae bacterium]|nr:hypothetical protein [Polyangiaceae bacterium]
MRHAPASTNPESRTAAAPPFAPLPRVAAGQRAFARRARPLAVVLLAGSTGCAARPAAPSLAPTVPGESRAAEPTPPAPRAAEPAPGESRAAEPGAGRGRPEGAALGYAPPRTPGEAVPSVPGAGWGGAAPGDLASSAPEAPPPDDWRKPVGLVGVAVGTTFIAMGVSASLSISKLTGEFRENDDFRQYRAGIQRGGDMCDAAERGVESNHPRAADIRLVRERCQTVSMWKVVQPVGYIGGGLLIAGGAALLISAAVAPPSADAAKAGRLRLRFAPSLGPSLAGATLGGAW